MQKADLINMGNEMICPCSKKSEDAPSDVNTTSLLSTISLKDLNYSFNYGEHKGFLFKTELLSQFFRTKDMFIYISKKKIPFNLYYNHVYVSNFRGNSEFSIVILQYLQTTHDLESKSNAYEKLSKSGQESISNYLVDYLDLRGTITSKERGDKILQNILDNNFKNYDFIGIVNSTSAIYKPSFTFIYRFRQSFNEYNYHLNTYEGSINSEVLEELLSEDMFNSMELVTVLTEGFSKHIYILKVY